MIYYKITDQNSKAWNLHELYNAQLKEARQEMDNLLEMLGLPEKYYTSRNKFYGVEAPKNEEEVLEGMRISKKGYMVPDRRTSRGKKIHAELKTIKLPANMEYMENIFGAAAMALVNGNRKKMGCAMKVMDDIVCISVHPKVLAEAKKKTSFKIPQGLQEITGSEYQELTQHNS